MKYEKAYTVGTREMGKKNKLTNYGILAFLEDVASNHSDDVGYGVKDIYTKKRAWLLLDWRLEVNIRPPFGEKILVKTWATEIEKDFVHNVYRDFEIVDDKNNLVATATSKWVFFNLETNRISKVDDSVISLYNPEGKPKFEINKIKPCENYERVYEYTVKRADIDVNNHLHNLDYINIAYEALPEEIYNGEELNNVHIMYKHQVRLNQKVKCFYSFENNRHNIAIKSNDGKTLNAIVQLW